MDSASPHSYVKQNFSKTLEDLKGLARIPSVSFDGFPPAEVEKSASAVAELMRSYGLENVQILRAGTAHPYVYGDWLHAPDAPTLLLYAHHDVQPVGRLELWESPPFEPTLRQGPGGMRLYGRGTADDKAGILVHLAAIDSFLKTRGKLPVNVKLVIEGEEETGSGSLPLFLKQNIELLRSDILVLTDTGNFDCGVPSLTVSLRGLVAFEVELRALNKTVHSGMWGGPLPDPVMGLFHVLGSLISADGSIAVPGVLESVKPLGADELARFEKIPFDEKEFRDQAGMIESAKLLRDPELNALVQTWRKPSLTVTAVQASTRGQAANIVNDVAWAKVTLRLVAGQDPDVVLKQVTDFVRAKVPWGLQCTIKEEPAGHPWSTEPKGPVFEAATRALREGYGKEPVMMGGGGSIPFVLPFVEALKGAPVLMVGVEDPYTNAHGENESLLISDFEKACVSQSLLFEELGRKK